MNRRQTGDAMATVVLVLAGLIPVGILLAHANPPMNARHAGLDFPIYPTTTTAWSAGAVLWLIRA
jgi:hypothetical protein